ncbi:MAG: DUF916 domain-containing protein, partial [Bacteroidetes bacterium]
MINFKQAFILVLAFFAGITAMFAQGLEVSPVRLDFSLEPGQTETRTVTVRNTSNKRTTYTLAAADWYLDETGNVVRQDANKNKNSCSRWMSFTPALVELGANESREVTVTMNVPSGEKASKWSIAYITIQKEQQAPQADKDLAMGIEVNQQVGVFVTQSPRSNKNASAKVKEFKEVAATAGAPRTFEIKTQNTGEKILDCNVYLVISDLQNATETKLEPISFRLLPEGAVKKQLALPADLKKGSYMVAA